MRVTLYLVQKPDVPAVHLVSYFMVLDEAHVGALSGSAVER